MAKKIRQRNNVIVVVTDEALPDIKKLAKQLGSKGLKVKEVMPMTGVISGTCPDDEITMAELAAVEGVMSIEKEITTELPPADNMLQ